MRAYRNREGVSFIYSFTHSPSLFPLSLSHLSLPVRFHLSFLSRECVSLLNDVLTIADHHSMYSAKGANPLEIFLLLFTHSFSLSSPSLYLFTSPLSVSIFHFSPGNVCIYLMMFSQSQTITPWPMLPKERTHGDSRCPNTCGAAAGLRKNRTLCAQPATV